MWDRQSVDFISSQDLSWCTIEAGRFGGEEAGLVKVLSRSVNSDAETSIIRVTSPVVGRLASAVDLYVLSGHATLNSRPLPPGAFVHVPQDAQVRLVPVIGPLTLYCGSFGSLAMTPDDAKGDDLNIVDVDALPWTDMGWRGDEEANPAVKIKWLRREGDLGIAFVVAMLPGWRSEREEKHPVYEESFKLYGDLLLGRRGVLRPGGYFFRGPESWHGPLYSRTGNMSLIRKNAFGSTDYRSPEGAFDLDSLIARSYVGEHAAAGGGNS